MELLMVKNISKKYKTVDAVKNISFNVNKGEILGLLGPNGAGKSTTISMISTLLKPDKGEIFFKGNDIVKKPNIIQSVLGYVPQDLALYPMLSGKENMMFWGGSYGLKGKQLKKAVDEVSEIIGINERLKDKVKNYSGGMKRRLNIGVALLHNPELLIMDEPTVGIDPQSRNHILDTVLELNKKGMTVIYTSHYMEEIEHICNRICIMDEGTIIEDGTKQQLLEKLGNKRYISLKIQNLNKNIIEKIKEISNVIDVKVKEDTLAIKVVHNNSIFKNIICAINDNEGVIVDIDIKEPNLESVFLNVTGHELRD
jgi:ABC-2 type transport system ATP-binding protein